MPKNNKND